MPGPDRLLAITVCVREPGTVRLPVTPGETTLRLDARAILARLQALVHERGLDDCVSVREGCAGACSGGGPNVTVEIYARAPEGHRQDRVAIDWKTYVYSIGTLDALGTIIDENVRTPGRRAAR